VIQNAITLNDKTWFEYWEVVKVTSKESMVEVGQSNYPARSSTFSFLAKLIEIYAHIDDFHSLITM
jgi:hypothetical protein